MDIYALTCKILTRQNKQNGTRKRAHSNEIWKKTFSWMNKQNACIWYLRASERVCSLVYWIFRIFMWHDTEVGSKKKKKKNSYKNESSRLALWKEKKLFSFSTNWRRDCRIPTFSISHALTFATFSRLPWPCIVIVVVVTVDALRVYVRARKLSIVFTICQPI